jgi:acyl carrier protein
MKPKEYLDNYFYSKIGKKNMQKLKNINLIEEGILDSLDIVTISVEIKKKFNVDIKLNNEKSMKIFQSYEKLLEKITK